MRYFAVKNLERFQHYKDRRPPWIKLYQDVLEDYEFTRLPDASKMHLLAIWLLASRTENKVPYDPQWIATAIHATERVNLDALLSAGFIVLYGDDSTPLAICEQGAIPETETEVEAEKVVVRPEPIAGVVIGQPADFALQITIAANHAVTRKWGEQTQPFLHGQSYDLAQSLIDGGVPLDTAKASIAEQVEKSGRGAPPKSINWFRPGILSYHATQQQRAIQAANPAPAPAGDALDQWLASQQEPKSA